MSLGRNLKRSEAVAAPYWRRPAHGIVENPVEGLHLDGTEISTKEHGKRSEEDGAGKGVSSDLAQTDEFQIKGNIAEFHVAEKSFHNVTPIVVDTEIVSDIRALCYLPTVQQQYIKIASQSKREIGLFVGVGGRGSTLCPEA